jgi:hypothetical protein
MSSPPVVPLSIHENKNNTMSPPQANFTVLPVVPQASLPKELFGSSQMLPMTTPPHEKMASPSVVPISSSQKEISSPPQPKLPPVQDNITSPPSNPFSSPSKELFGLSPGVPLEPPPPKNSISPTKAVTMPSASPPNPPLRENLTYHQESLPKDINSSPSKWPAVSASKDSEVPHSQPLKETFANNSVFTTPELPLAHLPINSFGSPPKGAGSAPESDSVKPSPQGSIPSPPSVPLPLAAAPASTFFSDVSAFQASPSSQSDRSEQFNPADIQSNTIPLQSSDSTFRPKPYITSEAGDDTTPPASRKLISSPTPFTNVTAQPSMFASKSGDSPPAPVPNLFSSSSQFSAAAPQNQMTTVQQGSPFGANSLPHGVKANLASDVASTSAVRRSSSSLSDALTTGSFFPMASLSIQNSSPFMSAVNLPATTSTSMHQSASMHLNDAQESGWGTDLDLPDIPEITSSLPADPTLDSIGDDSSLLIEDGNKSWTGTTNLIDPPSNSATTSMTSHSKPPNSNPHKQLLAEDPPHTITSTPPPELLKALDPWDMDAISSQPPTNSHMPSHFNPSNSNHHNQILREDPPHTITNTPPPELLKALDPWDMDAISNQPATNSQLTRSTSSLFGLNAQPLPGNNTSVLFGYGTPKSTPPFGSPAAQLFDGAGKGASPALPRRETKK